MRKALVVIFRMKPNNSIQIHRVTSIRILFPGLNALGYHIHFLGDKFQETRKNCTRMTDHVVPIFVYELVLDTIFVRRAVLKFHPFRVHFVVGVSEPNIHSICLFVHFVKAMSYKMHRPTMEIQGGMEEL